MNKKNIIQYLIGRHKEEFPEDKLIDEIEYALIEIETARNIFNNVDDEKLIEMAIYEEEVATKRFEHLLSVAKEKRISVTKEYIFDRFLEIVE
ncbi:MAG: DUF2508 family protein [Clostridium sp.]|nr:DUF2508 family protein [Clostridium sp.]